MESENLTIVIPAYNEAEALPKVLPPLIERCIAQGWKLIVVNDASSDATAEILSRFSIEWRVLTVIHHKVNRGYGGALSSGLAQVKTPFVITMDADGQHSLSDVEQLYEFGCVKDADLVIGSRDDTHDNFNTLYRTVGKRIIRFVAGSLVDLPIRDLNSGMKFYATALVQKYLKFCPDGMAFSDVITLIFLQRRHLVLEFPIHIEARKDGTSTINTMTAFDTVIQILNIVMVFAPLRIFLPVGISAICAGLLWAVPFFLLGHGLSTAALLLMVVGLVTVMLGLLAEQLAQIRRQNL